MPDEDSGKFRQRSEDEAVEGITSVADLRARATIHGLTLEKLDLDGQAGALEFTALLDRMAPEKDLEAGTDIEDLPDFGIALLVDEQRSQRCAGHLTRAQTLINAGQCRQALGAAEAALAAEPESGEAQAVKIHCLAELGHHEAALRIIRVARDRLSDSAVRVQVLRIESRCIRAMIRSLEERLGKLIEARKLDEALSLVRDGLRQQPSNIVMLHHLANLLWARGETLAAKSALEEARRHVGRENVDLIADLERKIGFGAHRSTVEAARTSLRSANAAVAIELLDSCRELQGDEHYDALLSYAHEINRRPIGQLISVRSMPRQEAGRQQVLRWLVSEELREAEEGMRAQDYQKARRALNAAETLAPDCMAVLARQGAAIAAQHRQWAERGRRPAPDKISEDLRKAELLLERIGGDPEFEAQAAALRKAILAVKAHGGRK